MMKSYTISLCMIVKNEEKYLDKCLEMARERVHEIIVVDTGSTDSTVEIAKKYGAIIYNFEWTQDFASARNYSISKATSDYILILDADEFLDEQSELQADLQSEHDYYAIQIKNYASNGSVRYHPAIRLFKNKIGLSYFGRIHEHLDIGNPDLVGGVSACLIHHEGYKTEVMKDKKKAERNYKLLKDEISTNPSGYNLYNMGIHFMVEENYHKAFEFFKKAYYLSKEKVYLTDLLYSMSEALLHLQRFEDSLVLIKEAIELFPGTTDLYYLQGKLYEELGYLEDAKIAFNQCLKLGDRTSGQTIEGVGGYLAHYRLAEIAFREGDKRSTLSHSAEVLKIRKNHLPSLSLYISVLQMSYYTNQEIVNELEHIYSLNTSEEVINLLKALYSIRHPLLTFYLNRFKLQIDTNVRAVAKQYTKDYENAFIEWNSLKSIQEENKFDILLLSILLADKGLVERGRPFFNVSDREWQVLQRIVSRTSTNNEKLTADLESILLEVATKLMILQEFDLFDYIIGFLQNASHSTQLELSKKLYQYNFTQIAIDILVDLLNQGNNDSSIMELLGDICVSTNMLDDAERLFRQSLHIKKKYSIYPKMYDLLNKNGNQKAKKELISEASKLFPLSVWVKIIQ